MVVTDQISALRALGADPIRKLVIPRVVAGTIMKSFADADARYARLLDILIAQLKAGKVLAAPSAMR